MKSHPKKAPSTWEVLNSVTFGEVIRHQLQKMKKDWRMPLLWLVELILAIVLAGSIAIYLDPEVNVVPAPWNVVAFVIVLGISIYLYGFTRPFRVARRMQK
ncbi:MAG: hypothetical protein IPJ89_01250 [Candidatus Iainarchaeum archaeon]|uniref:Uncharacterized protein n=1 Tax=Candidatus Iainarchaeum sp. TaxID=3101447 RepID=A0A7T9I1B5_9ARCH|nr:MAG: hypothetical protein IPJ89_01250 [Candidatus Diapherotrites archaeon]